MLQRGARARAKGGLVVDVISSCNHLVEIQADDHDLLVNSDNKNDDMLGYKSEKYSDAEDAARTNHSDRKLVKMGITRLYKFRMEYDKPGGIKIKIENKEIEVDEEPPRSIMWFKGRVNKDIEFPDDEIRLVGDKLVTPLSRFKVSSLILSSASFCIKNMGNVGIKSLLDAVRVTTAHIYVNAA
nr:hypothetical protein [Tanacetum cinerariifolium]